MTGVLLPALGGTIVASLVSGLCALMCCRIRRKGSPDDVESTSDGTGIKDEHWGMNPLFRPKASEAPAPDGGVRVGKQWSSSTLLGSPTGGASLAPIAPSALSLGLSGYRSPSSQPTPRGLRLARLHRPSTNPPQHPFWMSPQPEVTESESSSTGTDSVPVEVCIPASEAWSVHSDDDVWLPAVDTAGRTYFYSTVTHKTSWTDPNVEAMQAMMEVEQLLGVMPRMSSETDTTALDGTMPVGTDEYGRQYYFWPKFGLTSHTAAPPSTSATDSSSTGAGAGVVGRQASPSTSTSTTQSVSKPSGDRHAEVSIAVAAASKP